MKTSIFLTLNKVNFLLLKYEQLWNAFQQFQIKLTDSSFRPLMEFDFNDDWRIPTGLVVMMLPAFGTNFENLVSLASVSDGRSSLSTVKTLKAKMGYLRMSSWLDEPHRPYFVCHQFSVTKCLNYLPIYNNVYLPNLWKRVKILTKYLKRTQKFSPNLVTLAPCMDWLFLKLIVI